jgi:mannose-6-phosphate isomerase-like protein (cupin superfamily)
VTLRIFTGFPSSSEAPLHLDGEERIVKKFFVLLLFVIPLLAVAPQETALPGFEHWTPASLVAISQTLAATASSDPHHVAAKQLSTYPNEYFLLAHRTADGQPEWHETEVDVFVVQSGSATLLLGGTLVGAETTAPHEKRNGTIQGGSRQKLSAGDIVRIPARVPHQVLLDGAKEFSYFVIKVKGY